MGRLSSGVLNQSVRPPVDLWRSVGLLFNVAMGKGGKRVTLGIHWTRDAKCLVIHRRDPLSEGLSLSKLIMPPFESTKYINRGQRE